jgi:hypothetical protein
MYDMKKIVVLEPTVFVEPPKYYPELQAQLKTFMELFALIQQ